MRLSTIIVIALLTCAATEAARAEATCESIRTDLTGPNVYGEHTMKELMLGAQAGNCDYAAYLVRRARDAQGFIQTRCPADADLNALASSMLSTGRDTLDTPKCRE